METVAVIDFETTGLSPDQGARATEIAAVLISGGRIVDRYQSLMNAGVRVPPYIEALTGITNAMVKRAPPAAEVIREVAEFVGSHPLVAHNAWFDQKFWNAELSRVRRQPRLDFTCSMLVARRIYPNAPNHKLGTLVQYARVPIAGRCHRALADAEMTANLVLRMEQELMRRFRLDAVTHDLLQAVQRSSPSALESCVARYLRNSRA